MSATRLALDAEPSSGRVERIASGLVRRYRLLRHGPPPVVTAAEVALRQLTGLDPYAFPHPANRLLLAQVALALPVLGAYGQRSVSQRWRAWLLRELAATGNGSATTRTEPDWTLALLAAAVADDAELRSQLVARWSRGVQPEPLAGSLFQAAFPQTAVTAAPDWRALIALEAMVALGEETVVRQRLEQAPVPADFASRAGWTSLAFQLGAKQRAAAQMSSLRSLALRGGQPTAACRFESTTSAAEWISARRQFLSSSQAEIACHFLPQFATAAGCDLPDQIDPRDGRFEAVWDWISDFARPDLKIAEVGCGSGRFLRAIQACLPDLCLTGIDPCAEQLAKLPANIARQQGAILDLPCPDGAFDAVMAVEVLEHALVPAVAVDQLCRATRAGGQVLIIDKRRARQSLSQYSPWERWFDPAEVQAWLARHCREVSVRPITHTPGNRHGLFLAWTGVKRIRASH